MKAIKKIALCLAVLFVMQAMPIGVFAVSFKDALSEDSRGISVLAHYVKEDAGRAGMLYVNEYNQETIVKRSDASIMSDDAQLELIYYYSSYENGYSSHSPYGNHWKTNYDIKLQYDAENDQFIYLHNDGATVAFEKTDEMQGGDIYWKEKLTMLCRLDKLYVKQNSTNPADARIETKKGETLTFDSEGRLVRIKTQQSDVQISYHLNGISEISDAAGNRLQFNYGNDNRVETITGYQGKTPILIEKGEKNVPYQIQYQYDIKGRLISVTYPDGKSISYGYLFPDKLSTIQNIDEKCLEIAYAQKRAETIQQISSENPALSRDIASLKHNSNGNIIKSELFGETTYQYNEYGLLVYDDKTMAAIDKEAREVELASEKATVERVRPCNCEDCHLVACECECNRQEDCNCFSCNISISATGGQKVLSAESKITNASASQSDIKLYPSGYVAEETDSLGTKVAYQYDLNQNLTKVTLELAGLTDGIIENKYQYANDKLISIENNNTKYDLLYDEWGNPSGADIEGKPHVRYHYVDGNISFLQTQAYANGQCISYAYDDNGRISSISTDGKTAMFEYEYLQDNGMRITNHSNGTKMLFADNSYQIYDINTNKQIFSIESKPGRTDLLKVGEHIYDINWEYVDSYKKGLYSFQINTKGKNTSSTVDVIRDKNEKNLATLVTTSSQDHLGSNISYTESGLVRNIMTNYQHSDKIIKQDWAYEYDSENRLQDVKYNGKPYAQYAYDATGQLSKFVDYKDKVTITYRYDAAGNLLGKTEYSNGRKQKINDYEYSDGSWKDKLTRFSEEKILYDEIGNPIKYGDTLFSWISGRQMKSISNRTHRIEYSYDDNGMRQSKTVYALDREKPSFTYRYFWNDGSLVGFDVFDYDLGKLDTVAFILDDTKNPYGFIVNDTDIYLYEKNFNDDIIGIFSNGEKVAEYTYDSFGNIVSFQETEKVKLYNILFYRGYCYDRETDMYYLKSRYYVPEWGRFLNADQYVDTGTGVLGTNMYAYCENDPINYSDPEGLWKKRGNEDSHEKITRLTYAGENYRFLEDMIDANVWIDETYSATNRSYQKYHFDRRKYTDGSTDDTRLELVSYWIKEAIKCAENSVWEAKYLGRAMHSAQDYSSHGNIGINHWMAIHGAYADDQRYIWDDDKLRGSDVLPGFSGVTKTNGTQYRWIEAQENTGAVVLIYYLMRAGRL